MSNDNGTTFDDWTNLSNTPSGSSTFPSAVIDSDYMYVVWIDTEPGAGDVYFRFSEDGGETFAGTINLSNSIGDSSHPQIKTSGIDIYVTWEDILTNDNHEIFFVKNM